jgi:hypothetical protein
MSGALLGFMRLACEEARRRGLRVILYDEGMYPSGSSSGLVVRENPAYRCRAWTVRRSPELGTGETLVGEARRSSGERWWVVDRPIPSVIRGLHYLGEDDGGPGSPGSDAEETPAAADLLNREAMAAYLRLTHDRYAGVLGEFFGSTVTGIFTDEPSLLGRPPRFDTPHVAGTTGLLAHLERLTGIDFSQKLAGLFFEDESGAGETRRKYERAVRMRMEETYYGPMSAWCEGHGLELMGHPEKPDDLALQRYFHIPGQDLVWRWVLPGPTATRGPQSTQAKSAASAAHHLGRHRNSNEFAGAYGHELTFEEMRWLADHCLVRGQNFLIPHAYYYSVRGPRRDERPPDVGLKSKWAHRLREFNGYCERMCELVARARAEIRVAVVATGDHAPDRAAEALFQHQFDFHYVEDRRLTELAPMYDAIVYDGVGEVTAEVRGLGRFVDATESGGEAWLVRLRRLVSPSLALATACPELRVRRLRRGGADGTPGETVVLVFNESMSRVEVRPLGAKAVVDAWSGAIRWSGSAAAEGFASGGFDLEGGGSALVVLGP